MFFIDMEFWMVLFKKDIKWLKNVWFRLFSELMKRNMFVMLFVGNELVVILKRIEDSELLILKLNGIFDSWMNCVGFFIIVMI